MLIISPRYYFRYTTKSKIFNSPLWYKSFPGITKPILINYIASKSAIELINLGCTIIEYAPYTSKNQTRVKPQNVLYVDRPHTKEDIHKLMVNIDWKTDLRTINLDDYPEYFI